MTLFVYLNYPHPDRALIESLTIKNINRINLTRLRKPEERMNLVFDGERILFVIDDWFEARPRGNWI